MTDIFAVYECDKIRRGHAPSTERLVVGGFQTAGQAMDHANALARANRAKSYVVGLE